MADPTKQCPCGAANNADAAFCVACGQPIFDVLPTARVTVPKELSKEAAAALEKPATGKKVCPVCGTVNESFAVLCEGAGCGNDLMNVAVSGAIAPPPVEAGPSEENPRSRLLLTIGSQDYECRDGDIIGREGTIACQVFTGIGTVSRRHVEVREREAGWCLVALAHVRNITQLDGIEMRRGEPVPISGAHRLQLSTQCEIALRVVEPKPKNADQCPPKPSF